jgi:hypothetical protein
MAGTYADLFHGPTYGDFNGPLYGSGPSLIVTPSYFEARQELGPVIFGEAPTPVRAEFTLSKRSELATLIGQEPTTQRRSEKL